MIWPARWFRALVLAAVIGAAGCDGGCGDGVPAPAPAPRETAAPASAAEPVLARVEGVDIPRSRVEGLLTEALEMRARVDRPPGELWRTRKRAQLLEGLIEQELLTRAIADRGIVVDDAALDTRINAQIERTWKSESALQRHLDQVGKPMAAWREELRFDLAVERLIGEVDVTPDDKAVEELYLANQGRYSARPRVKLAAIVFRVAPGTSRAEVEQVRQRALVVVKLCRQPGARFEELARQHSEGPTAGRGGELGWTFRRDLDEALAAAAFRLPVGGVSEPIRTRLGYEVIKVEERRDAGVRELDEVRPLLVEQLVHRRRATARAELLAELERRYKVERFDGDGAAQSVKRQ